MRRHIVYLTTPDLIISPETCSITTSAFFLSHDIRRDVRLYIANDEYTIMLDGSTIRLLRPDAQSTQGLLRKVFQARRDGRSRSLPKGFTVLEGDAKKLLKHLPHSVICYPAQKGQVLEEMKFGTLDPALIVGLDRGKALEVAKALKAQPIRLNRAPLPANHEIVLFNIQLDRMGMIDGYSPDR